MIVLIIVTKKNREEIYFEDYIPKVHSMKLISCSLFNSWDALKKEGSSELCKKGKDTVFVGKIPPGHYSLDRFANEIKKIFKTYDYPLTTETNTPFGLLKIVNPSTKPITLDDYLANFLGINRKLEYQTTYVKKLSCPTKYFIYCDLIDQRENFFNGKNAKLLAKVDVRGKPFEKVTYNIDSSQNAFCDASTSESFNQITISVRDENGELFDFEGLP